MKIRRTLAAATGLMVMAGLMATTAHADDQDLIKIGNSMPGMGVEWYIETDASVHDHFSEDKGFTVTTVSCEGNAAQQVTDIENLVASGVKGIVIGSVDPGSTVDALKKAREAGVYVFQWSGSDYPETYDATVSADSYAMGVYCAEMASDWIDEKWPDAEDGSVDVVVLTFRVNDQNSERDDGLMQIEDINSKVNVVDEHDLPIGVTDEQVTEYIEMAVDRYPDVKVFLMHDSSQATVGNEVLLRNAEVDKENIALFACGTTNAALEALKQSADGNSVLRGLVHSGDVADCAFKGYELFAAGELNDDNRAILLETPKISLENVDDFLK